MTIQAKISVTVAATVLVTTLVASSSAHHRARHAVVSGGTETANTVMSGGPVCRARSRCAPARTVAERFQPRRHVSRWTVTQSAGEGEPKARPVGFELSSSFIAEPSHLDLSLIWLRPLFEGFPPP
jgi:hypothetical protein